MMMKRLTLNFCKTKAFILILILSAGFSSCKDEEVGSLPVPVVSSIDFSIVEGKYIGSSSAGFDSRRESMILTRVGETNFTVELFEGSHDFTPSFNFGTTPELTGTLKMEPNGSNAVLDLVLASSRPVCSGTYKGTGSRNNTRGTFIFEMIADEVCPNLGSQVVEFTYDFKKIED